MQFGGPTQRLLRRNDAFACSFQYDEEQQPCMVFCRPSAARTTANPPVVVVHLTELYKWADDEFLWKATKEMATTLSGGHYSTYEHRNLFFFVNTCMGDLFLQKPFPEALIALPQVEVEALNERGAKFIIH